MLFITTAVRTSNATKLGMFTTFSFGNFKGINFLLDLDIRIDRGIITLTPNFLYRHCFRVGIDVGHF